ncbi:MAG: PAS domain S-box protein [Spirochaetes bacterium]|nr:PAS domain S-box protein [Spirochaetota bacterium]
MEYVTVHPLSLFSFLSFLAYVYLGIYGLRINPRARLNRIFSLLCASFAVWSLAYTFIHASTTVPQAALWNRVGAAGWCATPSLALHFFLEMTGIGKRGRARRLIYLIYLPYPAFLAWEIAWAGRVSVFSGNGAALVPLPPEASAVYTAFIVYHIAFVGSGILYVLRRGAGDGSRRAIRQIRILALSTAVTLALCVTTDSILPFLRAFPFPGLAPIFILPWASGVWISIVRYRLVSLTPASAVEEIMQGMKESLVLLDRGRNITSINRHTEEVTGFTVREVTGRPLSCLVAEQGPVEACLDLLESGGEQQSLIGHLIGPGGEQVPASLTVSDIRDSSGGLIGFVIIGIDITERLKMERQTAARALAEEALRTAEQKYRLLTENLSDAIWSMDLSAHLTYVSPSIEAMLGYTPEEMLHKGISEYVTDESVEKSLAIMRKEISRDGRPGMDPDRSMHMDVQYRRKDGRLLWCEVSVKFLRDAEGMPSGVLGVTRDISLRKRDEQHLQEIDLLFRQITENMTDMITMVDMSGVHTYASPSAKTILGYEPEEIIGTSPFDYIHPDDQSAVKEEFLAGLRNRAPGRREFRYRRIDGTYVWLDSIGNVIEDGEGNVIGAVFSSRDISESKAIEIALKESEERYRSILENIEHGYYEVDLRGDMRYFNRYLLQLLDYTEEELIGLNYKRFMTRESAERVYQVFNQVYRTGETSKGFDWEFVKKDGNSFTVETTVTLIRGDTGVPVGFRGLIRDISERKKYISALEESEERYRQLVNEADDIIYLVDVTGTLTFINVNVVRSLEYTEAEMVGRKYWEFIDEEWREEGMRFYGHQFRHRIPSTYIELPMIAKDGRQVWFGQKVQLLIINDRIQGLHGVARDITELKSIQKKLQESERLHRLITETMWDMIIMIDSSRRLAYVSPSHVQLGYSPEDLTGKNPFDYIHPDDIPAIRGVLEEGIRTRQPQRGEFRFLAADGTYRWLECHGSIQFDERGGDFHIVTSSRDVTERKRAETALNESEKALRERNEVMERDLKNAQIIYLALMQNQIPYNDRILIDYRYYPMDAVGGDYFCFTPLTDARIGCFIGDVCGHGVSAALFLALLKATVDRISRLHGESPARFITSLNTELMDYLSDYFITSLYGFFDTEGEPDKVNFTFSKGGHPYPVLYRAKTGTADFILSRGTILGKFPGASYAEVSVMLEPGDRIYLYTDGIPEAPGADGRLLGYEAFVQTLQELSRGNPLPRTIDLLFERIRRYCGDAPLNDDLMLIGFEVR